MPSTTLHCTTARTLAHALLLASLAFACTATAEQAPTSKAPAATSQAPAATSQEPAATSQAPAATSQEPAASSTETVSANPEKPATGDSPKAKTGPTAEVFVPTEEISEDFAVPFPVDI